MVNFIYPLPHYHKLIASIMLILDNKTSTFHRLIEDFNFLLNVQIISGIGLHPKLGTKKSIVIL